MLAFHAKHATSSFAASEEELACKLEKNNNSEIFNTFIAKPPSLKIYLLHVVYLAHNQNIHRLNYFLEASASKCALIFASSAGANTLEARNSKIPDSAPYLARNPSGNNVRANPTLSSSN